MSLVTKPALNQFSFYENIEVLSDSKASGIVILDLTKSKTFLIHPENDIQIYINKIYNSSINNIPDTAYLECFVIIELLKDLNGMQLSFDPNITFEYMDARYTTIIKNQALAFHLFSYDAGNQWYGTFIGAYNLGANQAIINRPVINYPTYLSNVPAARFTIMANTFSSTYVTDVHESTDWKICTDELGQNVIIEDNDNKIDLVTKTFIDTKLHNNSKYYVFLRYKGKTIYRKSEWSDPFAIYSFNIEVDNPNTWRTTDFNNSQLDDGSFFAVNKYNKLKTIKSSTNVKSCLNPISHVVDPAETNIAYLNFSSNGGYIEFTNMSGVLTEIRGQYYGDVEEKNWYIAQTLELIADDNEDDVITCIRSPLAGKTTYSLITRPELAINKKLKIKFLNTTYSDENCYMMLYKLKFTLL